MSLALLLLLAMLAGAVEAILYDRRGAEAFTWNEHQLYTLQRVVLSAVPVVAVYVTGRHWILPEVLASWLCFPLFHDESYNFWRVLLTQQKLALAWATYRFGYQSPTTTARFDFNNGERLAFAALGIAVLVLAYLFPSLLPVDVPLGVASS